MLGRDLIVKVKSIITERILKSTGATTINFADSNARITITGGISKAD